MLKIETNVCVCGERAVKDYHDIVDEVYEIRGNTRIVYERLCERCYERVRELDRRFDFTGMYYVVEYVREKGIFVIRSRNEYGDTASLAETWRHTRKTLIDPYTRELVFVEGDRIIGVF